MIKRLFHFIIVIAVSSLGACSFFEPHKVTIQQGNIVTQKMIDQLKPGMSKRQVEYILGTPLIVDAFNNSQWHYNYSLHRGTNLLLQRQLTLHFTEGKLATFEGDFKPSDMPTEDSNVAAPLSTKVPTITTEPKF